MSTLDPFAPIDLPWHRDLPRGLGLETRFLAESHREAYKRARRESAAFHAPWEPIRPIERAGDEEFEKQIDSANASDMQRLIAFVPGGSEVLAQVNLSIVRPGPPRTANVGYWTNAAYARRSIATRAVALALDHAFDNLKLHRVQAGIMPSNAPSLAVANRIGFEEEGYARKLIPINGNWEDHVLFSMLAEDWPRRRSSLEAGLPELALG